MKSSTSKFLKKSLQVGSDFFSVDSNENSVLFVIGFSMADQHIQEITKRVARSNPTLQIYIFSFSKSSKKDMEEKMEISKYANISVIAPDYTEEIDKYNYDLETITNEIFKKINFNSKKDDTK